MAQEGWGDDSIDEDLFGSKPGDEVSSENAASEHGKGEELMLDPLPPPHVVNAQPSDAGAGGEIHGTHRMLDALAASQHNFGETLSVVSRAATRGSTTSSLAGSLLAEEDPETDDDGEGGLQTGGPLGNTTGPPMAPTPPPLSVDALSHAATKASSEGGGDADSIATAGGPDASCASETGTGNEAQMGIPPTHAGHPFEHDQHPGVYQPLDGLEISSSAAVSDISGIDDLPPEATSPDPYAHPYYNYQPGPESTSSHVSNGFVAQTHTGNGAEGAELFDDPERTSPVSHHHVQYQHNDQSEPPLSFPQAPPSVNSFTPEDAGNDFTAPPPIGAAENRDDGEVSATGASEQTTSVHAPLPPADQEIPELSSSPAPSLPLSMKAHYPEDETRGDVDDSMLDQEGAFDGGVEDSAGDTAALFERESASHGYQDFEAGAWGPVQQESVNSPPLPPHTTSHSTVDHNAHPPPQHDALEAGNDSVAVTSAEVIADANTIAVSPSPPNNDAYALFEDEPPLVSEVQLSASLGSAGAVPSPPPQDGMYISAQSQDMDDPEGRPAATGTPQLAPMDNQPTHHPPQAPEYLHGSPSPRQESETNPGLNAQVESASFSFAPNSSPPQSSTIAPSPPAAAEDQTVHSAGGLFGSSLSPQDDALASVEDQPVHSAGALFGASPSPSPQGSAFAFAQDEQIHSSHGLFDGLSHEQQTAQSSEELFGSASLSPSPPQNDASGEAEPVESSEGLFGANTSPSSPPRGGPFDEASPAQSFGGIIGANLSSPRPPPQNPNFSAYTDEQVRSPEGLSVGGASPTQGITSGETQPDDNAASPFGGASSSPSPPSQYTLFNDEQPAQNSGSEFGTSPSSAPPTQNASFPPPPDEQVQSSEGLFGGASLARDSTFEEAQPAETSEGPFGGDGASPPNSQGSPFGETQSLQISGGKYGSSPSPLPPPQDLNFTSPADDQVQGSEGLFDGASPSQDNTFDEAQPGESSVGLFGGTSTTSSPPPPPQDSLFNETQPAQSNGADHRWSPSSPPPSQDVSFPPHTDDHVQDSEGLFGGASPAGDTAFDENHSDDNAAGLFGGPSSSLPSHPQDSLFDEAQPAQSVGADFESSPSPPPQTQDPNFTSPADDQVQGSEGLFGGASPSQDNTLEEDQPAESSEFLFGGAGTSPPPPQGSPSGEAQPLEDSEAVHGATPSSPPQDPEMSPPVNDELVKEGSGTLQSPEDASGGNTLQPSPPQDSGFGAGDQREVSESALAPAPASSPLGNASTVDADQVQSPGGLFGASPTSPGLFASHSNSDAGHSPFQDQRGHGTEDGKSPTSPGSASGLFVDASRAEQSTTGGLFASPSKADGAAPGSSPHTPNADALFGSSNGLDLFSGDDSASLFDRSPTKVRGSEGDVFGGGEDPFQQGMQQQQQQQQQSTFAQANQQYPQQQQQQHHQQQQPQQQEQHGFGYQPQRHQQENNMYYPEQSMQMEDSRSRQSSLRSFGSGHYSQRGTYETNAAHNSPLSQPSRRESVTSSTSHMSHHAQMAFPQPQPVYAPGGDMGSDRFSQPSTGTGAMSAQDYQYVQQNGLGFDEAQSFAVNTGDWSQQLPESSEQHQGMEAVSPGNDFSLSFQQPELVAQQEQALLTGTVVAPRRMSVSSAMSSVPGTSRPLPSMPDNPIVGFGDIRRQDGRRPHALAIFGFGGRLVTMFPQRRRRLGSFTDPGSKGGFRRKEGEDDQPEGPVQSKLRQGHIQIFNVAGLSFANADSRLVARQVDFPGPLVALPPGSAPVDHQRVAAFLQKEVDSRAPKDGNSFVGKLLWQVIQLFLRGDGDLQGKEVLADLLGALRAPAPVAAASSAPTKGESTSEDAGDQTGQGEDAPEGPITAGAESVDTTYDVKAQAAAAAAFKTSSSLSEEAAGSAMLDIENMLEAGDREGAVVRAVESELWAQALIISNFVSVAAYRRVVERFVHATMPRSSQSHTLFMLFAGLGEKALAPGTDEDGTAGDPVPPLRETWRRTLSAILANRTPGDTELITSLGDRLWAELGDAKAAHICYLAAGVPLNSTSGSRMVLVGGDHKSCESHRIFVTPETIERTELYLYGLSLRNTFYRFDGFHPYRLVYAMWLADLGAVRQAYAWVQSIQEVLKSRSPSKRSSSSSSVGGSPRRSGPFPHAFQRQLKIFADRLMTTEAKALGLTEQMQQTEDSSWIPLRLSSFWKRSGKHYQQPQTPQTPQTPSFQQPPLDYAQSGPGGPAAPQHPSWNEGPSAGFGTAAPPGGPMMMMAPGPEPPSGAEPPSASSIRPPLHPGGRGGSHPFEGNDGGAGPSRPSSSSSNNNNNNNEDSNAKPPAVDEKKTDDQSAKGEEAGWGITSWMKKVLPKSNVKKGTTGKKLDAYYDKKLGKWVFPGDDPNAGPTAPAAPPKMEDLRPSSAPASGDGPGGPGGAANPPQYSAGAGFRRGNTKSRYVNTFAQSGLVSETPRPDTAPGNSGLGGPPTPMQQMMMPPGANPMMPPQVGTFPPGPGSGGPKKFNVFKPPPAPVAEEPVSGPGDRAEGADAGLPDAGPPDAAGRGPTPPFAEEPSPAPMPQEEPQQPPPPSMI